MIHYFDSSALVKRYVSEQHSNEVARLLAQDTPATARYSTIEIVSALARRQRKGDLSLEERDRVIAAVMADTQKILLVELTAAVSQRAVQLLKENGLRAGDALQLACCLHLHAQVSGRIDLVSFDRRLNDAATDHGIRVLAASDVDPASDVTSTPGKGK